MSRRGFLLGVLAAVVAVAVFRSRPAGSLKEWRPVEEVPLEPSPAEFRERLERRREPLLIRRATDGWTARDDWSDAYLIRTAGHAEFNVEVSSTGFFGDAEKDWGFEKMRLAQFAAQYRNTDGKRLYLNGRVPRSLHADFILPSFVPCLAMEKPPYERLINMWWGAGGEVSRLHNDLQDNILFVVRGTKRVVLFAPNQTQYLYERRDYERTETRISPIRNVWDESGGNATSFPLYRQAQMFVATVNEGEALYIPPLWWHHVESFGDDGCIIVNIWFDFKNYAQRGLAHVYDTPSDVLFAEMAGHKALC